MPAYAIFFREEPIQDQEAMRTYAAAAAGAMAGFTIKPLVIYGAQEACEGDAPDGIVMLEFPTLEEAKRWYNSPSYQEAAVFRKKAAKYRAVFVEGVSPPG